MRFSAAQRDVTATDLNAPMLEVVRAKFRPGEEVDFRPADACALPFPDGAFDTVVCQRIIFSALWPGRNT